MSDYPKMLYLGPDHTPYLVQDAQHEAAVTGAMSRTEPAPVPEPDHDPESDVHPTRRKKAHK